MALHRSGRQLNVTSGDTILADTKNTYLHSSTRMISYDGVNKLVIIEAAGAILIADKNQSQYVEKIINQLVKDNLQRKAHCSWGGYGSIDEGERF
jgi:mannose-1-phosphate guanylyltransferase/mannose-6-phosphate isomerase